VTRADPAGKRWASIFRLHGRAQIASDLVFAVSIHVQEMPCAFCLVVDVRVAVAESPGLHSPGACAYWRTPASVHHNMSLPVERSDATSARSDSRSVDLIDHAIVVDGRGSSTVSDSLREMSACSDKEHRYRSKRIGMAETFAVDRGIRSCFE